MLEWFEVDKSIVDDRVAPAAIDEAAGQGKQGGDKD